MLLTAQLIDGVSDTSIWSDAFPADMSNPESVFEIQAEIAMQVSNALHVEFLETEREQIERVPTQSRQAYERYLAAMSAQPDWDTALNLVEQALALDDQFIDAWILKAAIHSTVAGFRAADVVSHPLSADRYAGLQIRWTNDRHDRSIGH